MATELIRELNIIKMAECGHVFFFFKRGEGRKKGRVHTHNPGMCPDWESNWKVLVGRPSLNPPSHPSQGMARS